jgi:hypothetical protein
VLFRSVGGGIATFIGKASLDHSSIIGNHASTMAGGIMNASTDWKITYSQIKGNFSQAGGGIYQNGSMQIENSSISDNLATGPGAALLVYTSAVLTNCIIRDNKSTGTYQPSGIYVGNYTDMKMTNSTVNRTDIDAWGGFNVSDSTISTTLVTIGQGAFYLKNTILAAGCNGALTSYGYNLFKNSAGCSFTPATGDIIGQDPALAPLADNGGGTLTFALLAGSPAIDAGVCTDIWGNPVTRDQRGAPRGGTCDIGAFEYGPVFNALFMPVLAR